MLLANCSTTLATFHLQVKLSCVTHLPVVEFQEYSFTDFGKETQPEYPEKGLS